MIESLIALVALSLMEIVLGIDNIVFISILTSKLPVSQQSLGRKLGLLLALVTRIMLLAGVFWVAQLVSPIFVIDDYLPPIRYLQPYFEDSHETASHGWHEEGQAKSQDATAGHSGEPELDQEAWDEFNGVSGRDLILLLGGLFLIYNSVREIHEEVEHNPSEHGGEIKVAGFNSVILKIAVMDIIFSLDSVITAVGMANELWIMIAAVILAVGVMILFADQVGQFVDSNPTIKMLALNFLLLIGVMLVAEGVGTPINKGYIYFAMAFSLFVEIFNIRKRRKVNGSETLSEA